MYDDSKSILIIKEIKTILYSFRKNVGARLNKFNLTGPQAMIIKMLDKNGKMRISDLSKSVGLSNSTVSGIIDRLQKEELVKRSRSEKDRRVVYVSIDPKFSDELHENFKEIEEEFMKLIEDSHPEEIDTILKGLTLLQSFIYKLR